MVEWACQWRGTPERSSGRECFAIGRTNFTHNALLIVLALAIGLGAGVAGGVVATRVSEDDAPAAVTATVAASQQIPVPLDERLQEAIDRALPAVVTVLTKFPAEQLDDGRVIERGGIGSGIVVSDAGFVITNFHVVQGASEITIVLDTLEERPAILVGDDSPFTDLAVLLVPPEGLRVATQGNSSVLTRGDPVIAIAGGLFGFEHSVSLGIVSVANRSFPRTGVILDGLIQTDAAVNHGDSGGSLTNLDGEVVGLLTTVVRSDANGRAVQGVSFAQSADTLRPVIESIIATGSFLRPRTGIERFDQHIEIFPDFATEQGLPVPFGLLVLAPAPGSPADAAGVQPGDIVVALNGVAIDFDNPLPNLLKRLAPGQLADLLIIRAGRERLITLSPWQE